MSRLLAAPKSDNYIESKLITHDFTSMERARRNPTEMGEACSLSNSDRKPFTPCQLAGQPFHPFPFKPEDSKICVVGKLLILFYFYFLLISCGENTLKQYFYNA